MGCGYVDLGFPDLDPLSTNLVMQAPGFAPDLGHSSVCDKEGGEPL